PSSPAPVRHRLPGIVIGVSGIPVCSDISRSAGTRIGVDGGISYNPGSICECLSDGRDDRGFNGCMQGECGSTGKFRSSMEHEACSTSQFYILCIGHIVGGHPCATTPFPCIFFQVDRNTQGTNTIE